MSRTIEQTAHDLAMAAMPTGSAVEAWEDGYTQGWEDAMDTAITILRDALPDDTGTDPRELQAAAWSDGFVAGHVAGKTGEPPEQWRPNPYHTPTTGAAA